MAETSLYGNGMTNDHISWFASHICLSSAVGTKSPADMCYFDSKCAITAVRYGQLPCEGKFSCSETEIYDTFVDIWVPSR